MNNKINSEDVEAMVSSSSNELRLEGHPILANYPKDIDSIDWMYLDKETYMEIEDLFTKDVKLFDPILVENFYPQDMFDELVEICTSYDLSKIDFSNQMNKWEQGVQIPQKFIDYAVQKTAEIIGTDDVAFAYHMYAHHQMTSDGRTPKLPLHIDWAPGPYMVDLHIGGNRDWGFVARYKNFVTKPNQAIICQPQFDYHYRPSWASNDPNEYYQALFFHLVNKNHWCRDVRYPTVDSSRKRWDDKYPLGLDFRKEEVFAKFQTQRRFIFDPLYLPTLAQTDAPKIPWDEVPSEEDTHIHERKGVVPANEKDK
jgi:hypothetical protein